MARGFGEMDYSVLGRVIADLAAQRTGDLP
jgi:hypothetical protein